MPPPDVLLRSKLRQGKTLIAAGRLEEARVIYQQVCAKSRTDADNWFTLGVINGMLRRNDEAAACCSKAVELSPRHAAAWYNLGIALRDTQQFEKAADALRRALALDAGNQQAATSLGHVLITLHQYDEAQTVFREVLRDQPENAEFYVVYGSAMQTMGRYEAATNAYRTAIELGHPRTAEVRENMAAALCMQGKYRESIEQYNLALEAEPADARIYSNLLLTLHYVHPQDPGSLLQAHRQWPGNIKRPKPAPMSLTASSGEKTRQRIGYVSSDLRKHPVAFFVEPLLALHDPERYEIICYLSHQEADATTARLRRLAHRWRDVYDLDDIGLCNLIAADGIDILVDLNGHTSGNRLSVFARRAAPVQVSFIGYPDTTGLAEMDYRLSDAIADPPGAENSCTESLLRLPGCFLCYQPPEHAPAVAPAPCAANGFLTYGSFNNLAKVNPAVVALWAKLLRQIPASRLVLKNPSLTDESSRERYRAMFSAAGVSPDRIDLIGFIADDAGHLNAYSRIDVALDTFPYNGTTTTCEALWMGVPVVSLRGDRHSARVGASLLTAAGFPDWIAATPEHYMDIARDFADDLEGLSELRSQLRRRMQESCLCANNEYVKNVENAYAEMYLDRIRSIA